MSDKKEKKIVNLDDSSLLKDLNVEVLLDEYTKLDAKQKSFETTEAKKFYGISAEDFKAAKDALSVKIREAAAFAEADIINAKFDDITYRATMVFDNNDATKTDPKKLITAMAKIGKLDAKTIERIFKAAEVKAPRKGFIRLTIGEETPDVPEEE